jgi:protein-S-isoprenylcysteine O-methyltransferase Ste14
MKPKTKLILLTLLVYGIPIIIWSYMPYSRNMWGSFTSSFLFSYLLYGKIVFSTMGIIFDMLILYCLYLFLKKDVSLEKERVYLIASGLKKLVSFIFVKDLKKESSITKDEKVSLLFYLVKLYFTPVMMGFLVGNTQALINSLNTLPVFGKTIAVKATTESVTKLYFYFIFYVILVVDTFIFAFGYLFESPALKNVVKSVEPTAFGWLVALACYPPINDITAKILGWYSSDFSNFGNANTNIVMGVVSLLLFAIYLWASLALGFKASNLTNRGIVAKGPYKYVRHPAYASKNLSWWVMGIPAIMHSGLIAVVSLTVWSFIYFLRALTEERHLLQDPDYVEYSKKVKYMFFPGVY